MGFDVLDTGFIGCLDDEASSGCDGIWPKVLPAVNFTDLEVTIENTTGCYYKPILKAASLTHSLIYDSQLTFHVNCILQGGSAGMGGLSSTSGSDLATGMHFSVAQLLAGIDLNSFDGTNAAEVEQDCYGGLKWRVRIISFNNIDYPAVATCYDGPAGPHYGYIPAGSGPTLYTDGTGAFPQFTTMDPVALVPATGSTYQYVLQVKANVLYYADSSSMGSDSFAASKFKIEIQYDTGCDTQGGCGSYGWTDAIDNDTWLAAGQGGQTNYQTFDVVEADCWDGDYIFVRYRIIGYGDCCATATTTGPWTEGYLGEMDVFSVGVQCMGGGP